MRWALSVAVDSRRYEWSASGMNEQIFDLTGGEKFNSLGFYQRFKKNLIIFSFAPFLRGFFYVSKLLILFC